MPRWFILIVWVVLAVGCESTSNSTSSGGEKMEEAYHLMVKFLSYDASRKLYELEVEDIVSIPAAPVEVLAEGDVVHARDVDEGNQLRNKVLTQPPNQPFDIWLVGRPSMEGTDWIIRKYKIE